MRKLKKKALSLTQSATVMGLGGSVLGSVGGSAAVSGQAGLASMAGFLPATGSILGAGTALGELRKMGKRKHRKR